MLFCRHYTRSLQLASQVGGEQVPGDSAEFRYRTGTCTFRDQLSGTSARLSGTRQKSIRYRTGAWIFRHLSIRYQNQYLNFQGPFIRYQRQTIRYQAEIYQVQNWYLNLQAPIYQVPEPVPENLPVIFRQILKKNRYLIWCLRLSSFIVSLRLWFRIRAY